MADNKQKKSGSVETPPAPDEEVKSPDSTPESAGVEPVVVETPEQELARYKAENEALRKKLEADAAAPPPTAPTTTEATIPAEETLTKAVFGSEDVVEIAGHEWSRPDDKMEAGEKMDHLQSIFREAMEDAANNLVEITDKFKQFLSPVQQIPDSWMDGLFPFIKGFGDSVRGELDMLKNRELVRVALDKAILESDVYQSEARKLVTLGLADRVKEIRTEEVPNRAGGMEKKTIYAIPNKEFVDEFIRVRAVAESGKVKKLASQDLDSFEMLDEAAYIPAKFGITSANPPPVGQKAVVNPVTPASGNTTSNKGTQGEAMIHIESGTKHALRRKPWYDFLALHRKELPAELNEKWDFYNNSHPAEFKPSKVIKVWYDTYGKSDPIFLTLKDKRGFNILRHWAMHNGWQRLENPVDWEGAV